MPNYTENLIPIMTSNTVPSGIASASNFLTDDPPWEAFDGIFNTGTEVWTTNANVTTGWLAYEFSEPKIISKYSIYGKINNPTQSPRNWTFEGSNDGVTWIVLDTRTNQTTWTNNVPNEYEISNTTQYKRYRINITANNGSSYLSIAELQMRAIAVKIKHLIKSSNKIQTLLENNWVDTLVSQPLSKVDFETHGIDDLSAIPPYKMEELEKPYSILTWTDNTDATTTTLNYNYDQYEPKWLEIETDPFKPIDILNKAESFEVLTWTDEGNSAELQASGSLQAIDSGKLFSFELNDFDTITNIEII